MATRRLKPEIWLACSAVLVSVCALVVSMIEIRYMRTQQRMAVWPYLEVTYSDVDDFLVTVTNKGVGPARIRAVEVVAGDTAATTWNELLALMIEGEPPAFIKSSFNGRVVAPGEKIDVLRIREDNLNRAKKEAASVRITICYCSVYEDCWRGGQGPYENIESCDTDSDRRFRQ